MKRMAVCFLCFVLFFSFTASFTCSAVDTDSFLTTSKDLYSYDIGNDIVQGGFSASAPVMAASASGPVQTVTYNNTWNAGATVLSDNWFDRQSILGYILTEHYTKTGNSVDATVDDLFILGFACDNGCVYYVATLKRSNYGVALTFDNGNFNLTIGSSYPVVGWAIRTSTSNFVTFSGVVGMKVDFGIYNSGTTQHTISGGTTHSGEYNSVTFVGKHYYKSYSFSGSTEINICSNTAKTESNHNSFHFTGVTGWGQAPYPSAQTYQVELEQQQHEETKGLLNSIKNGLTSLGDRIRGFFDSLLDGIRALFIPEASYFSSYTDDLKSFFEARFGVLYQLPEFVISIFQKLISFNPATSGYSITLPELSAPHVENGSVVWDKLTDEMTYTFDILGQQPFSTLYTAYRSMVWLSFCVMLLNFITKKWNELVGGGSD